MQLTLGFMRDLLVIQITDFLSKLTVYHICMMYIRGPKSPVLHVSNDENELG